MPPAKTIKRVFENSPYLEKTETGYCGRFFPGLARFSFFGRLWGSPPFLEGGEPLWENAALFPTKSYIGRWMRLVSH